MAALVLAEEEIYRLCASSKDVTTINLPKTDEFVVNNRNQKLHVRTSWPEGQVRAIVVFCHGYGGHCSRPWVPYFQKQLTDHGYAFVGLDWHAFGYSDGIYKAFNASPDDFIDDLMSLLHALYTPRAHKGHLNKTAFSVSTSSSTTAVPPPFFLQGFSMGGPVVLVVGHHLKQSEPTIAANFKGFVLLAPALAVNRPPPAIVAILDYVVVPLFGSSPIWFHKPPDHTLSWTDKHYMNYCILDGQDTTNGLGYGGGMRFRTASTILQMVARAKAATPHTTVPYLVLHDPEDKVTFFSGSQEFFDLSGKYDLLIF